MEIFGTLRFLSITQKKTVLPISALDPTIETIKHHCVKDSSVKMIFFFDNAKANLFWMDL